MPDTRRHRGPHPEDAHLFVLTTIEAALAQGVLLGGRDGCVRDLASMHGSYRHVDETEPALTLIGQTLDQFSLATCCWYLDRPVSNSGRLRARLEQLAAARGWPWQVELSTHVDAELAASPHIVATADSVILDRCRRWFNLAREVLVHGLRNAALLDLADAPQGRTDFDPGPDAPP